MQEQLVTLQRERTLEITSYDPFNVIGVNINVYQIDI